MSTAQDLINKFKDAQTLPHVVTKLSKLIADPESTMQDFENVIKMDPVLVARLLQLVNSPYYGLTQKVDSISRAVAFLGMKNLHNIAVTDAMKTLFQQPKEVDGFSRQQLWLHCAAVSICSKMLAERIFGVNGDDAYLCGILHDFGMIIEEQVTRDSFLAVCKECKSEENIIDVETRVIGTNHCEIGYLLTSEWSMPAAIQEAIRDHHNYNEEIEPTSLTGIIQLSEYITGQMDYTTLPGVKAQLAPNLADHIEENLDEYEVLIEDLPEEIGKARDMHGGKGA